MEDRIDLVVNSSNNPGKELVVDDISPQGNDVNKEASTPKSSGQKSSGQSKSKRKKKKKSSQGIGVAGVIVEEEGETIVEGKEVESSLGGILSDR